MRDGGARVPARRPTSLSALYETKDRESVLGTYSIDEDGDTTLTDYGVYTVKDAELVLDSTIKAKGGPGQPANRGGRVGVIPADTSTPA